MQSPPFTITTQILNASMRVMQLLGELDGLNMSRPKVSLRKFNTIQTIHASLAIEGNTLSIEQVTDIIEGAIVLGPKNDILEVKNAIAAYDQMLDFNYMSKRDFKQVHKILMTGLIKDAGVFRKTNVGVYAGSRVAHVAPQVKRVEKLMEDLFHFLKSGDDTSLLIKSCVFHYELEFIHPFTDGNGRMARLWQHVILSHFHEVFQYLAIESLIKKNQSTYYATLAECDEKGDSTSFIEFCLRLIEEALTDYATSVTYQPKNASDRLQIAKDAFTGKFSRKEYADKFKNISTATASRDLKLGVDQGLLIKKGDKRMTTYQFRGC